MRRDCVRIVTAPVLTTGSHPPACKIVPENTIDSQSPHGWLAGIENLFGNDKRLWLKDRGIPTEEVLSQMRARQPPAH